MQQAMIIHRSSPASHLFLTTGDDSYPFSLPLSLPASPACTALLFSSWDRCLTWVLRTRMGLVSCHQASEEEGWRRMSGTEFSSLSSLCFLLFAFPSLPTTHTACHWLCLRAFPHFNFCMRAPCFCHALPCCIHRFITHTHLLPFCHYYFHYSYTCLHSMRQRNAYFFFLPYSIPWHTCHTPHLYLHRQVPCPLHAAMHLPCFLALLDSPPCSWSSSLSACLSSHCCSTRIPSSFCMHFALALWGWGPRIQSLPTFPCYLPACHCPSPCLPFPTVSHACRLQLPLPHTTTPALPAYPPAFGSAACLPPPAVPPAPPYPLSPNIIPYLSI